jgi:hypothetical protein
MNKKRKILTLVALAVFGAIIFFHYYSFDPYLTSYPGIEDVRMPILVLAVFYAGLFFLFGGKDAEPVPRRPRNWRRIKVIGLILAGLVVIVGLIAAIIHSQEQEATRQREIESEKRERAEKIEKEKKEQAEKIEEETSKHRIASSEIDLIDFNLGSSSSFKTDDGYINLGYLLTGRIRNRSAYTLTSIKLKVQLYEKEGSPDILREKTVRIEVRVPPHQIREISRLIAFEDSPALTQYAWDYAVTEIRGSKGKYGDLFDMNAPAVSPTPSPKP